MELIETVAAKRVFIKGQKGFHTVLQETLGLTFVESEAGRTFWIRNDKIQVAKQKALARKAAKEAKVLEDKLAQEQAIKQAVEFLTSILPDVILLQPHAKTEEQAIEFETFYRSKTGEDIAVKVSESRWGKKWAVVFPYLHAGQCPIPLAQQGKVGHRGPRHAMTPQAKLLQDGRTCELANTEVTLRLIEAGLRFPKEITIVSAAAFAA